MGLLGKIKNLFDISFEEQLKEVAVPAAGGGAAPSLVPVLAPPDPSLIFVPAEHAKLATDFRNILEAGKPNGEPYSAMIKQLYIANRSREYKSGTDAAYRKSARKVRALFEALDDGKPVTLSEIRVIVDDFLTLIKTDRNILLNLSYLPTSPFEYLFTHSVNVSLLSMALATAAGYSEAQVREIAVAALLIDVGMMRVPEAIRDKPGKLDESELYEVRKHPVTGADMMDGVPGLSTSTVLAIYQHHERMSGSGYPKQRSGKLIHDYSRIIAITDTYAAMVANRNHRKRLLPYDAMSEIIKLGGSKQLDSDMIRRFLETMSLFPLGSLVKLESGAVGKIIEPNPDNFTRPSIFVLKPGKDHRQRAATVLDLSKNPEEKIVQALDEVSFGLDPMTGF